VVGPPLGAGGGDCAAQRAAGAGPERHGHARCAGQGLGGQGLLCCGLADCAFAPAACWLRGAHAPAASGACKLGASLACLHASPPAGGLPSAWSALTQLRELRLGGNKLGGTIPWSGAGLALPALRVLDVAGNRLVGSLPPELSAAEELHLGFNQLSGPIPLAFGTSPWLRRLVAPGNALNGSIPDMSGAPALAELDLSFNPLSGPLPGLAAGPSRLVRLRLEGIPGLSGALPASVSAASPRVHGGGKSARGAAGDAAALLPG
jgi:hypothetical protein